MDSVPFSGSMDKTVTAKLAPGIYSTSLVGVDQNETATTIYHPLKQQINRHQLAVDLSATYNCRSRTNSNIIERRYSNVEQTGYTPEQMCRCLKIKTIVNQSYLKVLNL